MSREYHITLSEEEINDLLSVCKSIWDTSVKTKGYRDATMQKLIQAKQKPYTNFDKIKYEMTIKDLFEMGCSWETIFKKRCKTPRCDMGGCPDCRKWLRSEVKEDV